MRAELAETEEKRMVYGSRSLKRRRRTKAAMAGLESAIAEALAIDAPMTVRQVFYRLVAAGRLEKTEAEYRAVGKMLVRMRRGRRIPLDSIADNTRWMHKPPSFHNLSEAIKETIDGYRLSPWDEQPVYVEVWLEKDALAGVLSAVTFPYDVPLMVTRGYPSISFLALAAETIASQGKPTKLYYFGDHDPSGLDITRSVIEGIREFAPDAEVILERMAVTPEQIKAWNLPTRPTKSTDARATTFDGESVELDAIAPQTLRDLCTECIVRHAEPMAWAATQRQERQDRKKLATLLGRS